jgi:hypothetical protein
MSPEAISQVAAAAGLAGGVALEARAQHNAEKNGENLQLEAATRAIAEKQANAAAPTRATRTRRWLGRHATAPLALLAAGAMGMGVYSLEQQPETITPPVQPKLEMVVDHSGATNLSLDGKPTVLQVNALASEFAGSKTQGEALVASQGTVNKMPISKVEKSTPFGPAPLEQATTLAIDTSSAVNGQDSVLVITNGNSVGDTAKLTKQAKKEHTPVFVVNVENATQTADDLKGDLEKLAKDTGGKYWDANKGNLEEVADSVKATLEPAEAKSSKPAKWPIIEFGAVLALAGVGMFRRRSQMASLKNYKGQ